MAALTEPFNAPELPNKFFDPPVKASTKLYAGGMGATDASGWAVPASDTAGLIVHGRTEADADNSGGSNGDITCHLRKGVFGYNNSTTNALTKANVKQTVFVEDDNTVASTSTNKVVAGILEFIGDDGLCYVRLGETGTPPAPRTVALTSTDGVAGAAADLTALKAEAEKIGDDVRAMHAALKLQGILK